MRYETAGYRNLKDIGNGAHDNDRLIGTGQIPAFTGAISGLVEFVSSLPLPPIILMIAMQPVLHILGTLYGAGLHFYR
jgi:hypothetical protein